MVFVAQIATAGGVRAPLAHVADQVFHELTRELSSQGLSKNVIADMFGMALRTYHRRVQAVEQSKTFEGQTVWAAVLEYLRQHEPVSGGRVLARFKHDDGEIVSGALSDLSNSGLVYRAGRGERAVYRVAKETDFVEAGERDAATRFLVWLAAYRHGPLDVAGLAEHARVSEQSCEAALRELVDAGQVRRLDGADPPLYTSERFEVSMASEHGWEAAVIDHFQAMVAAITKKLNRGSTRSAHHDVTGGSTWSLDVWPGHPHYEEARTTLARLRQQVDELRARIDRHNEHTQPTPVQRVVFYMGQHVAESD
jgi:hypothetical protein